MKIRVSVVMATYNGEKYLKDQINSILKNLNKDDELVISDDGSTDKTIKIIQDYIKKDLRIKLFKGPRKGVKQNFANAIEKCTGDYIFLSDQDDVWMSNKVKIVIKTFKDTGCSLVVHNAKMVDSKLDDIGMTLYEFRNSGAGILKNIIKNSYIGCCMAFDAKLKDKILPIPDNIEMHDQWIGILCEKYGKTIFINDFLIQYRRHASSISKLTHYTIGKKIKNKYVFIKEYLKRKSRI